jgi:hypothetical protein
MPITRRILAAAAAIALAIGLTSGPAHALSGNWTVVPNTAAWLFSTDPQITNNGAVITSTGMTIDGVFFDDVPSGGTPDPGLDHVGNLNEAACDPFFGPLGHIYSAGSNGIWTVHADSQAGDIVNVRIKHIQLGFAGPGCSWKMSGTAHGTYDNGTGVLSIDEPEDSGNLVISDATCGALYQNGQSPGFSATFAISPHLTIDERT